MTVIWAHGQQHFKYTHSPMTGLEFCTVRDIFFYRKDVPMYHGHVGSRGSTSLNLVSDPNADNNDNVFARDADTKVTWVYDAEAGVIRFTLTGKATPGDWVALGVSDDKAMANTDVMHVGLTPSGTFVFSDRYATGYSLPQVDVDGETPDAEAMLDNGVVTVTLTRPIKSPNDDDLSLDVCRYLIIGTGSGVSADGSTFSRHDSTPVISQEKFCLTVSETGETGKTSSGSFLAANLAVILSVFLAALLH